MNPDSVVKDFKKKINNLVVKRCDYFYRDSIRIKFE